MMVAQLVKLREETLTHISTLAPSTGIPSVLATTNWFFVTPTSTTSSQLKQIIVKPAKKPWIKQQPMPHGLYPFLYCNRANKGRAFIVAVPIEIA